MADYIGSNNEDTLQGLEKARYGKRIVRAVPDTTRPHTQIKFKKLRNILQAKNTMLLDK